MGKKGRRRQIIQKQFNSQQQKLRRAAGAEGMHLAGGLGPSTSMSMSTLPSGLSIPAHYKDLFRNLDRPLLSLVGSDVAPDELILDQLASSAELVAGAVERLVSNLSGGQLDPEAGESPAERDALISTGDVESVVAQAIAAALTAVDDQPHLLPFAPDSEPTVAAIHDAESPAASRPLEVSAQVSAEVALCTRPTYKFPAVEHEARTRQLKIEALTGGAYFRGWNVRASQRPSRYDARGAYEAKLHARTEREQAAARAKAMHKLNRQAFVDAANELGRRLNIDMTLLTTSCADEYVSPTDAAEWAKLQPTLRADRHGASRSGPSWNLVQFVLGRKRMTGKPPLFLERNAVGGAGESST